ncbi:unnamed protein product [Protopolystoma xenopodis]|uniref:Uncharacterized protein n=1 Tax=Protopolystoma xenopodis TaxID=117903 RepID=A0A3S5BDT9_9PLAT|nr:unnamed protein product [Protopolystoma xenopodis]
MLGATHLRLQNCFPREPDHQVLVDGGLEESALKPSFWAIVVLCNRADGPCSWAEMMNGVCSQDRLRQGQQEQLPRDRFNTEG